MAQTLREIKKGRKQPRKWLWDGLIREGSVNVLVAAQSSGKSQLALGLIKEMLKSHNGQTFLERGVRRCSVLYLSTEMKRDIIADRMAELGVDDRMAGAKKRFFIYDQELNLAVVEREIAECNPDLIVIDIMGGLFVGEGLEINSYDAFNTIIPKLRRTGKTFLLIHHQNKMGKAMGSVGSLSAMDTRMEMEITEKDDDGKTCVIYQKLHVYGKEVAEQNIDVAFKYPNFELSVPENDMRDVDKPLSKLMQTVITSKGGIEGTYQEIAAKCQLLERYQFNPKRLGSLLRMNADVLRGNKIFFESRKIGGLYKMKIWYDENAKDPEPAVLAESKEQDLTLGGILHVVDDYEQINVDDLLGEDDNV